MGFCPILLSVLFFINDEKGIALQSLEATPLTYIDTLPALQAAAERLARADELAVDLEHHGFRSFQGFTCLMQISTREEDLIIDTLALMAHVGPTLGPLFADPQVLSFSIVTFPSSTFLMTSCVAQCHLEEFAGSMQTSAEYLAGEVLASCILPEVVSNHLSYPLSNCCP